MNAVGSTYPTSASISPFTCSPSLSPIPSITLVVDVASTDEVVVVGESAAPIRNETVSDDVTATTAAHISETTVEESGGEAMIDEIVTRLMA